MSTALGIALDLARLGEGASAAIEVPRLDGRTDLATMTVTRVEPMPEPIEWVLT